MTTSVSTNGIDVEQLVQTIDAIKADPDLAAFTFRANTSRREGTRSVAAIGGFRHAGEEDRSRVAPFLVEGDEPPALLGGNNGPNAVGDQVLETSPVRDVLANRVPVTNTLEVR